MRKKIYCSRSALTLLVLAVTILVVPPRDMFFSFLVTSTAIGEIAQDGLQGYICLVSCVDTHFPLLCRKDLQHTARFLTTEYQRN